MAFKTRKSPTMQAVFTITLAITLALCGHQIDAMAKTKANSEIAISHTRHLDGDGKPLFSNRLIKQDSLYLQQHAHNPVDWWPWGDEAFNRARKLDKPVLLSIGYSTCHWCHVMARESFEDPRIAEFINANFIAIKVDREERPDIDELYITAVQMLSGKAGWPLTAVLTPEGLPFFGGTYFPPDQFLGLLNKISDTWINRRPAVMEQAGRLKGALDKVTQSAGDAKAIDDAFIAQAQQMIQKSFTSGAQNSGSTFPREPEMMFLLDQALSQLDHEALAIVVQRLHTIAAGGIHDQLGGGFHRYSVDADWQVPHFEKMLYNQAQLGQLYAQATMFSGDPGLRAIAESTFDFMLRELQSPEGGFYAAIDADSEGREGTYYVWTNAELQGLLSDAEMQLARRTLGVSATGNFAGSNVLHRPRQATTQDNPADEAAALKHKLLQARSQRPAPHTDTKIISAWNGMAISALISGYEVLGHDSYRQAALRAAENLWNNAWSKKQGLARTIRGTGKPVAGSLEDYAYFARSLLDLYDLDHQQVWLQRAADLTKQMIDRFYDADSGGFLISSNAHNKKLIVDLVTARDDAINSGNSVAAQLLARLYRRTGDIEYRRAAQRVLSAFAGQLLASPQSLGGMLVAASLLNRGELGQTQYGANGKVRVSSQVVEQRLLTTIDIVPGWHINSWRVLEAELIPTALVPTISDCATIENPKYPEDLRVSLGFQEDELLVFEGQFTIEASVKQPDQNDLRPLGCKLLAAELRFQACSDEVCLSPENMKIRANIR